MKISVFGSGYVGLVTGASFAYLGHEVICADISADKINTLNAGGIPIFEQGLHELIQESRKKNSIRFTTNIEGAIKESDILFITVGTPSLPNGNVDLSQLWSIIMEIAANINDNKTIVIKSTVPVGTSDEIESILKILIPSNINIDIVNNPEFLRQGNAINDFLHPDRIIIGTSSEKAKNTMTELYKPISAPILFYDRSSTEMVKYAANAFLAMKISYINMLSQLSEKLGANIEYVAEGIGTDKRIGNSFLKAGIGYGGSCFPKDINALLEMGKQVNVDLALLSATREINEQQPMQILYKLKDSLGKLKNKKICLLGLAFKPMTDDVRDAPSLRMSSLLLAEGAIVHAYDPLVRNFPNKEVILHSSVYKAVENTDAIVILTDWDEFKLLDWFIIKELIRLPLIVDGRNMFSLSEMRIIAGKNDFVYFSVGRTPIFGTFEDISAITPNEKEAVS